MNRAQVLLPNLMEDQVVLIANSTRLWMREIQNKLIIISFHPSKYRQTLHNAVVKKINQKQILKITWSVLIAKEILKLNAWK